jgi:hypothetical protein
MDSNLARTGVVQMMVAEMWGSIGELQKRDRGVALAQEPQAQAGRQQLSVCGDVTLVDRG